jgi:hypothetical protein
MALESWVLDSIPLTSGNFLMMELKADPPKAKPEWIAGADSEWATLRGEPNHENREFVMKLRIPATAAANMDAALDLVASIRDKLRKASRQTDGIALVWTPNGSARSRTFDVLHGEITELPIDKDGEGGQWFKGLPIFALTMTAKPAWYDTTETLTSTSTAALPVGTIDVTGVGGDIPALARLIVTDNATQSRRDVEWGLENRNYNAGLSFIIDSDSMTLLTGTQTTRTGAYDPNATGNNIIRAAAVLPSPTAVCATGAQSHIGTFRIWARCWVNTSEQRVRLAWRYGDNRYTNNTWATPPLATGWVEIDLGTITIPTVLAGTQTWDGRIEVYDGGTGGLSLDIDYLRMTPAGEGYGRARSVFAYAAGTVAGYDNFSGLGTSVLNARVATLGGTWATSGATTDFVGFTHAVGGPLITRATTADAGARYAILGATNYTNVEVSYLTSLSAQPDFTGGFMEQTVLARYVDASNWAGLFLYRTTTNHSLSLVVNVAGSLETVDLKYKIAPYAGLILTIVVYTSGVVVGRMSDASGNLLQELYAVHSALATGGALATGKPGLRETTSYTGGSTTTRYYDSFQVATPAAEQVVINSTRSIQFRHDDTIRLDSTGAIYGRPQSYRGGRFLVPPGSSRIAVASRRVDLAAGPADNITDSTTLQVGWRARGLVVPRV